MTFSDPVDRLLYQDVLLLASSHQPLLKHVPVVLELVEDMLYELRKASVSNHVQGQGVACTFLSPQSALRAYASAPTTESSA